MPPLRLHVGAHNIAVDNRHPLSDIASLAAVSNDMLQRAIADAHEVGGFSPLLDVEIRDEEANDGIAAGTVGMLDNTKGSGPFSVVWRLREHWTWEGKKILSETNRVITE